MNKIISIRDAAKLLDMGTNTLRHYIVSDLFPMPDVLAGRRRFYSPEQFKVLKECVAEHRTYYTVKDASRELGICYQLLRDIAPPTHQFGRRKYYSEADLVEVRKQIDERVEQPMNSFYADMEAKGLYSAIALARLLDVPVITLRSWIDLGQIPKGVARVGGLRGRFWTVEQIEEIRKIKADYLARPHAPWKQPSP